MSLRGRRTTGLHSEHLRLRKEIKIYKGKSNAWVENFKTVYGINNYSLTGCPSFIVVVQHPISLRKFVVQSCVSNYGRLI